MGALDYWWNAHQSVQIDEMNEKIEKLEKRIVILEGWIRYLAPVDFLNDKNYEVGNLEECDEFARKRNETKD